MKSIYVQLLGTTLLLIIGSASSAHAQQLTETNVAQFEVTEPGFITDGPPIFNATVSVGENQLVIEPFNFGGKSRFWVHGLQPGDQVTVGAPGHEQKTVVYRGEPLIDMWLYRTSAYTPAPSPINWNLAYESAAPVSAAVMNDKVFYVYSLYWPQYPLVVSSMGRAPMQLSESSTTGAALAAWNGNLFLAWQGVNNNLLNVMSSSDEGRTWQGKVTLPVKTNTKPALAVINGQLALAWTQGFDNG